MSKIAYVDGVPYLFADVPNAGVAKRNTGATGNPNSDVQSGKFAPGPKPPESAPTEAPNVGPDDAEYDRMLAAVRDAAREFDRLAEGDIKEFLAGRAKNPEVVDIENFLKQVKSQEIADIADLLDKQFRSEEGSGLQKGRRSVTLSAPKNYLRKLIASLEADEVDRVVGIMASRGHEESKIRAFFAEKNKNIQLTDNVFEDEDGS